MHRIHHQRLVHMCMSLCHQNGFVFLIVCRNVTLLNYTTKPLDFHEISIAEGQNKSKVRKK